MWGLSLSFGFTIFMFYFFFVLQRSLFSYNSFSTSSNFLEGALSLGFVFHLVRVYS